MKDALGILETKSFASAVAASEACLDTGASVAVELIDASFALIKIEGELAAVQKALEHGARIAQQHGHLISARLIPRVAQQPIAPPAATATVKSHAPSRRSHSNRRVTSAAQSAASTVTAIPGESSATVTDTRPNAAAMTSEPEVTPPRPLDAGPVAGNVAMPPRFGAQATVTTIMSTPKPWNELEAMTVVELRQYARSVPGLPIQGRQISAANKQQLLEALREILRPD